MIVNIKTKKECLKIPIIILLIISLSAFAYAHGVEADEHIGLENIEKDYSNLAIKGIIIASIIITVFAVISLLLEKKAKAKTFKKFKKLLFLGIIIPAIASSLFLAGSTIYLNIASETKGPVHWHADFEIWNCGEKIDLINPEGLTNRIGSSVFHEHGDNRIHVEGVVTNYKNVDLHNFFNVIGGKLAKNSIVIPTNKGIVELKNRDSCNNNPATLQVFLYKTINDRVHQEKLENFPDYVISPHPDVPPGDCIIIELSQEKQSTSHICETYRIALEKGEIIGS